jgi:glycosyltransferase involved in cell wall biosynthesis
MNNKPHIEWLTKSDSMFGFLEGKTDKQIRGGRTYEIDAINTLKRIYTVTINRDFIKRSNIIKYVLKKHKHKIKGDICVLDPYVVALGKFDKRKKNIVIIHHIDEKIYNKNLGYKLFYRNLIRNLKKMDVVVVVSEVWKSFLQKKGIKNVRVIYNAFNVDKYNYTAAQIVKFKSKYNLDSGKPLIYLGQLANGKGVEEVYEVIDKKKFQVIVTSKSSKNSNITTHYFSDVEFPLFLACCDVVLCMSSMPEGWNRIAHEALLTKTPVIGSGSGGMRELLQKSGQLILNYLSDLNNQLDTCIKNSSNYGDLGWEYVSQFDMAYFDKSWKALIGQLSQ